MAQPAAQPHPAPPQPHLPQAQEAQRQALFQAAARVTRHHVQKFEQQLAAQAGAQRGARPALQRRETTPAS